MRARVRSNFFVCVRRGRRGGRAAVHWCRDACLQVVVPSDSASEAAVNEALAVIHDACRFLGVTAASDQVVTHGSCMQTTRASSERTDIVSRCLPRLFFNQDGASKFVQFIRLSPELLEHTRTHAPAVLGLGLVGDER